jgi:hypothetical protein
MSYTPQVGHDIRLRCYTEDEDRRIVRVVHLHQRDEINGPLIFGIERDAGEPYSWAGRPMWAQGDDRWEQVVEYPELWVCVWEPVGSQEPSQYARVVATRPTYFSDGRQPIAVYHLCRDGTVTLEQP